MAIPPVLLTVIMRTNEPVAPAPTDPGDTLLLEDGDDLLLETGEFLLLE